MKKLFSEKFTARMFLWTGLIFIILFSSLIIYRDWTTTNNHFNELMKAQARMGLEFNLAIRDYIGQQVRPFAETHVESEVFLPEVMSTSYVSREVFEQVCQEFPDYIIKFSSDNPRNPANQASREEMGIIRYFNDHPEAETWTGRTMIDGKSYLASFRARRAEQSCLHCHGDPADAPESLVSMYGHTAGFQRPVGEVIALDTVAVPAASNQAMIAKDIAKSSGILIGGLLISAGVVYSIYRRLVSKLLDQNKFLQTVIESLSYPFCVVNADDYTIELANSSALERQRCDPETGREAMQHQSGRCEVMKNSCVLEEVKKTKQPAIQEHLHYDADGHAYQMEVHGYPIFGKDGCVEKVIEYSVDVTDRKAIEHKIRESEQRLSTILHSLCSGIVIIDAQTHEVIDMNAAAEDMIGLSRQEILGRVCHDLICPEDKGACPITDLGQCLNRAECVLLRADGSEMPILKNATQVEIDGRECVVENFFDLTPQKKTEQILRESRQQAENAARMKSRFLANMSHEIRTPMNSIIGFCDLLFDECLTDEQQDYLETIRSNGRQLLQLINDILDFSKIEAGKLRIAPHECSLDTMLAEIEAMVMPFVQQKDLAFEIQHDQPLPQALLTDGNRLKQCLINLINNAIKFTQEGGIHVCVKSEQQQGRYWVRFDVEDTGIGISPEMQNRIFDSFTQADDSTTRKYGGTGLGLAITRQLAGLLGGSLTLVSEEGVGSIFSLVIPVELKMKTAEPSV